MAAKLIAIAGPLKGGVFPIPASDFTVGREASNTLCLEDHAVSRRHCVIHAESGRFRLRDLKSRNGTLVNQVLVDDQPIESGDELTIGASVFLFTLEDGEFPVSKSGASSKPATQTVVLRPQDSVYLRSERVAVEGRSGRDLAALLRISTEISRLREPEAVTTQLAGMISEVIPCERALLVLLDESEPDRSADRRAALESVAVLEDDRVLAVPLISGNRTLGLLRLEAGDQRFDEGHLQFVSAVGAIASLALENATHIEFLEGENRRLRIESEPNHEMVGDSPPVREVLQLIARAAPSEATILIQGESGTGKELAARAIHNNSNRRSKAFVAINCASLNENLLESELFGHEKGAFTGAVAQKRGKLEVAEGGTLFLDEIGEMALSLQSKLLRVLQEREFERVGGTRTLRADLRLIAATNRDLQDAAKTGAFRQDLYYRLNVISVTMPPLRERRGDIPAIANFFASRFAAREGRPIAGISPAARACLVQYEWPGNVRELENAIERAVVLGSTDFIQPEDLPEAVLDADPSTASAAGYHEFVREAKRKVILSALERGNGTHAEAARLLGVNPTYLSRLIRNLGLKA
ncbi:MAG: sigma 54-interacting transcriptional regulator [Bryobacteraceae bacterium]